MMIMHDANLVSTTEALRRFAKHLPGEWHRVLAERQQAIEVTFSVGL